MDEQPDDQEVQTIGWRDILTNLLGVTCTIVIALAVLVSVEKAKTSEATEPPGTMEAVIQWTNGPIDVDLWVMSDGEKYPVGFSHKTGAVWDLLRDDLGISNDDPSMPINIENAYSRTAKPGHYVFNIMCWTCNELPVTVHFTLRVAHMGGSGDSKVLITSTVELTKQHQEITVVALDIDKFGNVVPGSVNNVYVPMSGAWHK